MKRIAALIALLLPFVFNAYAEDPDRFEPGEGGPLAALARPVVLMDNVPDVAECRGILTQNVLDLVLDAGEDPHEVFERWRRENRTMMEESPLVECQSKLWRALQRRIGLSGNVATVPGGTEALGLRSEELLLDYSYTSSLASVGSNVNPAGGVENYQGEMQIAVNPNNHLQLVAGANTFYRDPAAQCQSPTGGAAGTFGTQALYGSSDGGQTWVYRCAPWHTGVTGGVTSATAWFGSDPAMAWDNNGNAYAVYMLLSQNNSAQTGASIVIAKSTDVGQTWTQLGIIVNRINVTTNLDDKEFVAIDNSAGPPSTLSHPGRIYVIWDQGNVERVAYSDNGTAWTTVLLPSGTSAIGGNVVVGRDGTVYVIWSQLVGNPQTGENIRFSKSVDGGNTWTAPVTVASPALLSFGGNNTPPAQESRSINSFGSLGIDSNPASPYFNQLYVTFNDFPTGTTTGTNVNVYTVTSSNGGTSWSPRTKVNDDAGTSTQFFPWMSVDPSDGTLNVSWYDTRLDPANNRKTQIFYARSSNGGVSYEPNILVTDNGGVVWRNGVNYSDENTTDNATRNANQYGDYAGIVAANRQVHPFWMDSRSFFPLADTVAPTRREDAASATIVNCSAPSISAPAVNPSCSTPSVNVSWAGATWGTNATSGTYSVYRNTTNTFPGGSPLASNLTATSYIDFSGVAGTTYFYFVRATNNCPGTALTPMTTDSAASPGVVFGACGTPFGVLQGTVTSAGLPVSGALVTAGSYSAFTNASGFYQFTAIDAATYSVTASASGYNNSTANGVVVTDGGTTTQNFSLTPLTPSACVTDTTYNDFTVGTTLTTVDPDVSPGDVKLQNNGGETTDQVSNPAAIAISNNLTATAWTGQTFRAGVTGNLTKIQVGLGLASGTSGTITCEIRNLNGANPGTTVLATTTLGPVTNVGTGALYTATFATPAAVVSGTSYSVVLRLSVGSQVFGVRGSTAGGSSLANGQVFTTTNSGTAWTAIAADLWFTTYVTPPLTYQASGNLVSTLKDSGAVAGTTATWTTLSWTGTTPANTSLQFQIAATSNAAGPFTFVGPDGTAGTFFTTSGASLSQFNGKRYLKYKAYLATTNNAVTPTLSDVTICSQIVDCNPSVPAITPAPPQVCANSTGNTASGPAGQSSYLWQITNGSISGSTTSQNVTYSAGASGNVGLTLTITTANGCQASNSVDVPINPVPATPTATPGGPTTFCNGGSVTITSSSASGNQWYDGVTLLAGETNQTYVATASGNYNVVVTQSGCSSAPSNSVAVTVTPGPATPTATPGGPTTFCQGGSVTITSSSATGNQWYDGVTLLAGQTNQTYVATTSGNYNVVVTVSGCSSTPSNSVAVTVNPTPPTPTATPGGPTTFCQGGSVTITSSSATGNQWYDGVTLLAGETNQSYVATASGNYHVVVTLSGCSSAASSSVAVTVNPAPPTPTATPGGPTTFCQGGSVTLTSSSATGNQWYDGVTLLAGQTNQTYIATTSGDYNVVVTQSGCPSAPSNSVAVTVNPTPPTPTITPGGPTTFCQGGSVTLTSSSATGNQWYDGVTLLAGQTNQTYVATTSGNYNVVVTQSGCPSAPSASTAVTVNPIPPTPTATPGGPTTFCAGGSVTITSSSATGNKWYDGVTLLAGQTNQTYVATTSGNYNVVVTQSGCPSAPSNSVAVTVNPTPPTPTITPGGPTTFCAGGSVTLTSSSATGNQWYDGVTLLAGQTNQTYVATTSGNYNVVVTVSGCPSAPSNSVAVTVNPAPPTPTATPGGPTTFCQGGSVTLTSSSATGNQWYDGVTPLAGQTNQTYVATTSGNYNVVVIQSGCPSAPSNSVAVTVNPIPPAPTATPGGPTTFCAGGSVTITSSSATGNQWYDGVTLLAGQTNQTYVATTSGNYNVVVTVSGCPSAPSNSVAVTVNPAPPTPTATPGGPTTFCQGGSVTLTSSSATGNQWYDGVTLLAGQTNQTYVATTSGNYNVVVTQSGCPSAPSNSVAVTVNPIPSTPTATPGGPTTFCAGGSVTLTSSSATGNQWYDGVTLLAGQTNQTYVATASGNYNVVVTVSGCPSAPSSSVGVTVNPIPPTPTITPNGPTTFCAGGNVILSSDSASGNQWYLNGNPIGGATNQTYTASAAGDYTVAVTLNGCQGNSSAIVSVNVNPLPSAAITAPASMATGTSSNASVPDAGSGATYSWSVSGGTLDSGNGTSTIAFTAGPVGTLTINVTVMTAASCSSSGSANVNVTAVPPSITVTNVSPNNGPYTGGTSVTITGTGFQSGATATFGGNAATGVTFVNSTTLTATTPAHAAGAVNVTVTNPDTSSATLNNGYTYNPQRFDANGDGVIDPADIFYLVNYLFSGGPAPSGPAGLMSGDANGDNVVDPADIFYVVNYLFLGGPQPLSVDEPSRATRLTGAIRLGAPMLRDGRTFIPVLADADSIAPRALSLNLRAEGGAKIVAVRRAGEARTVQPAFETTRATKNGAAYLLAVRSRETPLSGIVAEIEVEAGGTVGIDPQLTMLSDAAGRHQATAAGGTLQLGQRVSTGRGKTTKEQAQ